MVEFSEPLKNRRTLLEEANEGPLNSLSRSLDPVEPGTSSVPAREVAALLLIVILCDLCVYRAAGYAGPSLLFVIAPILLCSGITRCRCDKSLWLFVPMLVVVSGRLIWCGSWLAIVCGCVLLVHLAMSVVGIPPSIRNFGGYCLQLVSSGFRGLTAYVAALLRFTPAYFGRHAFAVILPLVTLSVFAAIFVLANPHLVTSVATALNQFAETVERWLAHFRFTEVLFCCCAAWVGVGALRPDASRFRPIDTCVVLPSEAAPSLHYAASRNTLISLIALFAVYLIFEFQTLWLKTFSKGFHFSGYAHEGAAWLTVALGLATLILSLIFRAGILADPRLPRLRLLAWIWSFQNLLLAMAVFNRLFIYIGFNGMTRMRVVGMLGAASVVTGFLLVLRKIARNRDFIWLIRHQLWAVSFAVYLYAVLPVDAFVNQFNVNRIMSGNLPPCVQISVHPTSDEGWLYLRPLIHCSDIVIRDGVRAMLSDKLDQLDVESQPPEDSDSAFTTTTDWTAWQIARDRLREQLRSIRDELQTGLDSRRRGVSVQEFRDYAYQWY